MNTPTINIAEGLEQGTEYKLLIEGKKRRVRMTFLKLKLNEYDNTMMMEFYSPSAGHQWYYDQHILDITIAEPLKPKQKKGITCTRCLGNKVYEKFSHINGGKCFKCEGTGII